ncbi:MAG: phage tail assembly protein [bacterium]|nr:phage tail assembly protein [bacterium]
MEDKKELMEQENTAAMGRGEGSAEDGTEESLIIMLKKPYPFEGKEYTEIDLSGLEDMTAADMIAVEKQYDRSYPGVNVMPEVKVGYAMMMAARAAKLPVEFFDGLPQREAMKVKNRVMGFLFESD